MTSINKSILAIATILLTGCNDDQVKTVEVITVEVIKEVAPVEITSVKNVILMIGDGMGAQQVGLLEEYARHAPNSMTVSPTQPVSQIIPVPSLPYVK
ncbi:protein of unknown function, might belong to Alkaline phosphatase [Shewanella benthica]|uniref:Alkaline phosphatase n=1 Tax=Shewanella benthica TaxID=43661 RepID=A0A330LVH0_9GAMM|nr:protein of unknown function, might belong to Alkaline phosphatase [Shewanella benthica]